MEEIESRTARRQRLAEEAELALKQKKAAKKKTLSKVVASTLVAGTLFTTGWFGYTKLVIEPRLDEVTIQETAQFEKHLEEKPKPEIKLVDSDKNPETPAEKVVPITDPKNTYENIGILYAPKLGDDFKNNITVGDDSDQITHAMAIDTYGNKVTPGAIGNFAVAGHIGYEGKARFDDLHLMENGDDVFVYTDKGYYRYSTVGKAVVDASNGAVLAPVPNEPGVKPTKRMMTLTTCYYEGLEKKRLVVWAELEDFTTEKPSEIKA